MNLSSLLCYDSTVNKEELWGDKAPLLKALPVLVIQMALSMGSNLVFLFLLRPLRQPRIVIDLLSALAISPIVLEKIDSYLSDEQVWPRKGTTNMEMLANMGLLYSMFIQGLQMDLTPVNHRRGLKAISFSLGVILLPFIVGSVISSVFSSYETNHISSGGRAIFVYWGAVLASSCFPTVASVLARLKLLCTEVGRPALCIVMINDLGSWLFIVLVIAISALPPIGDPSGFSWDPFLSVFFFTLFFWGLCFSVVRPLLVRAIANNKEGENFSESAIHIILFMVMAAGLAAEFFGAYAFLGAFILGLSIPHGFLAQTLADKMDDCVSALLMPLYYVNIVIMMRGADLHASTMDVVLIVIAVLIKPLCVLLASAICNVPFRDGLAISVLLNSKGLLSIVIVAVGFERGHLTKESVVVLLSIILGSTVMVEPLMLWAYNRVMKNTKPYDNRTIGGLKPEDEFRVITCVQAQRNIPGVINLLEISGTSQLSVFALHLIELIGRTSAMLIVHESSDESNSSRSTLFSRPRAQSDQIITAFQNYERQHQGSVTVQTLTIVSPLETMHDDICHLAEDKQVSMILLPFHKQQGMDGKLEDDRNMEIRSVNQNVMAGAPCTIGLLIDRGIGMLSIASSGLRSQSQSNSGRSSRREGDIRVAVLYFGGPDDREALSYAGRLLDHSNVTLALTRFVSGSNPVDVEPIVFPGDEEDEEETSGIPTVFTEHKQEKDMDNEFVARFLESNNGDKPIEYTEMASNSGADTVAMMREMDHHKFDLYLVGRGLGVLSPTTAGLIEWSECPELGAIGDVIVTSDFASDVSVLVVQQYAGARIAPPEDAAVIDFEP